MNTFKMYTIKIAKGTAEYKDAMATLTYGWNEKGICHFYVMNREILVAYRNRRIQSYKKS